MRLFNCDKKIKVIANLVVFLINQISCRDKDINGFQFKFIWKLPITYSLLNYIKNIYNHNNGYWTNSIFYLHFNRTFQLWLISTFMYIISHLHYHVLKQIWIVIWQNESYLKVVFVNTFIIICEQTLACIIIFTLVLILWKCALYKSKPNTSGTQLNAFYFIKVFNLYFSYVFSFTL